ncbi:DMT family transporter [Phaeocystidibacter marisrubri]|uniref:DMT family transporter n=1 Tax=Phaeocystidibacter marisrubri TaxID=1577780 RepID=A0A6L3ZER4_9FLAO|nr:DMT family transporter [Phaeocystidibacter marisrubri]KAB2816311.1 DMT family transporter [Phaeocystidibacter marisrubri]GGH68393.1 multidrug transporter [Phaeocystidibacter marisrubri]
MTKDLKLAHLALLSVAMIYGANYILAKDVMDGFLEPRGFILLRAMGATLLFWLFHRSSKSVKIERGDYWRFALAGLFGVALNQIMFFEGLQRTTPINASIIMTVNPIVVMLLSALLLKESLGWAKMVGILLGAVGAGWLISGKGEVDLLNDNTSLGNILVFINATSYGLYLIVVKPLMAKYPAIQVVKWVFLLGFVYVLPFGAVELVSAPWSSWTIDIYWKAGFVVLFTTFFAYLFNLYAMKTVSSTTVSAYIYLQPFFATIFALMLGTDELSWRLIGSAGLIFVGVYLANFYKKGYFSK